MLPGQASSNANDNRRDQVSPVTTVKGIVVATDFSQGAERALAVGIEMAQAWDATIDLIHVHPPITYTAAPPVPGSFATAPSPVALERIERALDELAKRVRDARVACRCGARRHRS